jgi:hypothetical protein
MYENMSNPNTKTEKKVFTASEKKLLYGVAQKIGKKRGCSGMYVRYIINGERKINTELAKAIRQDLIDLLNFLKPDSD